MAHDSDTALQRLVDRLLTGDPKAPDDLIEHSIDRLRRMARKRLKAYPHVRRPEETDDVLQNALIRLHRALKNTQPTTVAGYFGLAATQIRRELIDLARHHYGPEGDFRHHESDPKAVGRDGKISPRVEAEADPHTGPETAAQRQEFHEAVEKLPAEERQVFELIVYQGLEQKEVERLLGHSIRTIRRRYRDARMHLHDVLKRDFPDL